MANMSYCRFQNTLRDLRDCERAMNDGEADNADLDDDEKTAKKRLIRLCIEIAKEYGPDAVSNALYAIPRDELTVS